MSNYGVGYDDENKWWGSCLRLRGKVRERKKVYYGFHTKTVEGKWMFACASLH